MSILQASLTQDRLRHETIKNIQCQPSLSRPRFVAIYEHMEKFYDGHSYSLSDFKSAKKTFDEEFWCHAPNVLKYWREKVLEDPINHRSITRYAIHLKLYKYQIQNPLYRYPNDAEEKSREQGRICANIIQGTWGNFE